MRNRAEETRFPAVDRLRETLRADLVRAARTNPRAQSRFFRRRRMIAVVVVLLALIPAALAGAGVFDSHPDVEYECPEAEKQHDDSKVVVGAPVKGPDAPDSVEQEKPSQREDPCD